MARILLTHVYAWPEVRRGGERYLHEVAAGLAAAGHDVRVVTTAPEPRRARIKGVDVTYLRRHDLWPRRFGELSAEVAFGARALTFLGHRRYDVWHALGTADAAAAAIAGSVRRTRSVYTDLGITARHWRERRADRRLYDIVVRRIDRYICLSEAAAQPVRRDYGRAVEVLGGGVDLKEFVPSTSRSETPTLLFPAAVGEPRKNFPLLLEAFAILLERRPDARLLLAGSGDPAPFIATAPSRVRDAVVRLGVGDLTDLPRLYATAWATVLPSSGEAFGLVVLESLASGTPVVTLDDGGPAELVAPGVGSVAKASAASLADACEEALALAPEPGSAERCRAAAEPHDWARGVVPRLERIYCEP